ncbi:MAG: hypothetical protein U1F51_21455 [Burkholderiales bacterium]
MTDTGTAPRDDPTDDWIERALAADAAERRGTHVDDAGFTARVMQSLPAPVRLPRWRRPVEWVLAGTAGLAIASSAPALAADFARELFRLLSAQPVSLSSLAVLLAAIGIATFGAAALVLERD